MADKYVLAIDQGTSGTKAVVFSKDGSIVAKSTVPLESVYPKAGYVEQDPDEIVRTVITAVTGCIKEFTDKTGESPDAIAACGISDQRETFVLWDKNGKPLHNAVVWQCKRSVGVCDRLKGTPIEDEIIERTGLIVDPYFSGTKLMALSEENADVKAAIDSGNAHFGTVDSWLLYKLTNGESFKTDYTNACRTLFFNINDLAWDPVLLEKLGVPKLVLPEPHPSSSQFGSTTFGGLLKNEMPICSLIGDSHASAFGQGCFEPGMAKVTMGTGSSILMNVGATRPRSSNGMMSTICFSTQDRVDYALEGIIVSCGSTLTWLKNQIGMYSDVSELGPMARSIDSNDGVFLVPAFSGLGAPHWKMSARAVLSGMTLGTTKEHIVRAALESIPYQVADVMIAMARDAGVKPREIVADGGISQNSFVMQLAADLVGAGVVNRGIHEVSALGAAGLAGIQAGVFSSTNEIAQLKSNPKSYSPRKDTSASAAAYEGWKKAVANVG